MDVHKSGTPYYDLIVVLTYRDILARAYVLCHLLY